MKMYHWKQTVWFNAETEELYISNPVLSYMNQKHWIWGMKKTGWTLLGDL